MGFSAVNRTGKGSLVDQRPKIVLAAQKSWLGTTIIVLADFKTWTPVFINWHCPAKNPAILLAWRIFPLKVKFTKRLIWIHKFLFYGHKHLFCCHFDDKLFPEIKKNTNFIGLSKVFVAKSKRDYVSSPTGGQRCMKNALPNGEGAICGCSIWQPIDDLQYIASLGEICTQNMPTGKSQIRQSSSLNPQTRWQQFY